MNITQVSQLAKKLKLGKILYKFYYQPNATIWFRYNLLLARYGENQLKSKLQFIQAPQFPDIDIDITFMTGEKYWHQTVLCALSLVHVIEHVPHFTIYDDGTLNLERIQLLKRLFPQTCIITKAQAEANLEPVLPKTSYPALWTARTRFVQMRKLIDINILSPGKLYLDSDMIFWQYPSELIEFYNNKKAFFMVQNNVPEFWGFICDTTKIFASTGIQPIPHFNAGIFFLGKTEIDWDLVESWTKSLMDIPEQHNPITLEQTLLALIFAQIKNAIGLPDAYYVASDDNFPQHFILTHYINNQMKLKYMNREWYRWFSQFAN